MAITSVDGNGTWQYQLNGQETWQDVSEVSNTSALLLGTTDLIRYVPDGENGETATFTYQAWDQTTGGAGTYADASAGGGTSAFSSATDTASLTVGDVNDAPVLTPTTPTLTGTDEDTTSTGQTVGSFLADNVSDVDNNALQGVAITSVDGNGTWQYQLNGQETWQDVSEVSNTSALLLGTTDLIRYVPDGENGETATFTYQAWDQTTGGAGTYADASAGGGTSAFSSATDTASLTVGDVNVAPVLTPTTPTLTGTDEDTTSTGQTVGSFLADNVSDVDNNALQGVAITSVDGNGTWQYQLNGQETWQDVSEVSNTSALLLGTTDLIRYVPDGENGETATFTYQAWDQTTGGAGTYADASAGGGTSAFSSATDTASLTVGDVNDAPVLTPTTPTLTGTDEDTTSTGQTVGSFLADNVSDVDNNALQGVAITSVDGNGTWQYQLNGQETWQDVSEVSNTSALLLGTTDLIRYVPDGENGETATFTYQAWDQTTGGAGTYADASAGGGTSAFSSATDTASLTVGDVNDAPVLTPTTPTLTGTDEDTTSTGHNGGFLADNVSDVDNNALQGVAITSVDGNGTWQYQLNGQETWQDVSEVSNTSALLLGTTDLIRYVPDGENGETATFTYQAWDQTTGGAGTYADASAGGGTSAFSSATDTASLTVGDVNVAPVLTPTTPTLTGTDEDTTSTGQTVGSFLADNVSDVDNNALQGVAITSVDGNGTWQYQLNGRETWQDVSEVSNTSALLLGTTDLIRYVPDGENGETATFTYQAWDQTTGGAGTYADASAGGGTSAFSSATDTASLTVGDVNDAPVLTPTTPTLTGTDEDTTSTGQTVGSFLADNVSDVDNNALQGVAITSVDGNGTWQYQLNGQETWQDVSEVSNTSALLLGTTDLIRYVPDGENGETATFTYQAWDQTTGGAGTYADASAGGGTSAFSSATYTASTDRRRCQ